MYSYEITDKIFEFLKWFSIAQEMNVIICVYNIKNWSSKEPKINIS